MFALALNGEGAAPCGSRASPPSVRLSHRDGVTGTRDVHVTARLSLSCGAALFFYADLGTLSLSFLAGMASVACVIIVCVRCRAFRARM